MNRLVIIGNGFDLAHGLPTGYQDFIDDYWNNINEVIYEDEFIKLNISDIGSFDGINNYGDLKNKFETHFVPYGGFWKVRFEEKEREFILNRPEGRRGVDVSLLKFKNVFFQIICNRTVENWVDIENEYYNLLKECLNQGASIVELNREFKDVKFLLEKYLHEKVESIYKLEDIKNNPFLDYISDEEFLEGQKLNSFYQELPYNESIDLDSKLNEVSQKRSLKKVLSITNYFLNFNYTDTVLKYFDALNINVISLNHLHGRLKIEANPINFGFGDEMDKHYQAIEEKNDNEYLRNIKSFQYFHTPNYKQLLDLIDSEYFQVYIMGHSCGLSDRTLLNTVFEHNNCRSIKVFYHKKEDGTDNYTEIIQNVSRHFNNKKLMRSKIVNKTLCQPLPQIQLPKKNYKPFDCAQGDECY